METGTIHADDLSLMASLGSSWLVNPERAGAYLGLMRGRNLPVLSQAEMEAREAAANKRLTRVSGKVAVIPMYGVVEQRTSMFGYFFGSATTENIGRAFDQAMGDSQIKAIVLDIASPGGTTFGVQELGDKIFAARGNKQVIAVANSYADSAAYWVAAQADQLIVTPGGEVGSIGVYALHVDYSKQNEMMGVNPTYVYQGKYKVEMNPDEPLTEEATTELQRAVDETYGAFVGAVARGRGVAASVVKKDFGQGRTVSAKRAVELGMADKVLTLDQVLETLTGGTMEAVQQRKSPMDMMRMQEAQRRRKEVA